MLDFGIHLNRSSQPSKQGSDKISHETEFWNVINQTSSLEIIAKNYLISLYWNSNPLHWLCFTCCWLLNPLALPSNQYLFIMFSCILQTMRYSFKLKPAKSNVNQITIWPFMVDKIQAGLFDSMSVRPQRLISIQPSNILALVIGKNPRQKHFLLQPSKASTLASRFIALLDINFDHFSQTFPSFCSSGSVTTNR